MAQEKEKEVKEVKGEFSDVFEEVGALWDKEGKFSISFKRDISLTESVHGFKNKFHGEKPKSPSYRLFVARKPDE